MAIIKRFFPDTVAQEPEHARTAIPPSQCEHANQALGSREDPERFKIFENDLSVGVATPVNAARLEARPEFLGVVDFTIVANYRAATGRNHWLGTSLTQINDRQATMPECNPGCCIDPRATSIRSAMTNALGHHARKPRGILIAGPVLKV